MCENSSAESPKSLGNDIYDSYSRHVNPSYPAFLTRFGINAHAVRAEGAVIWDTNGKSYIDCTAGYGLFNLGHNHPAIIQTIIDQLNSHQLLTRPLITPIHVKLAEHLAAASPGDLDYVFMCNSGSEAIDSALKLARLATGRKQIIAAEGSFHGYTYGALSATGIPKFRQFFEPLLPAFEHVAYGDIDAMKCAIGDETAAVLLEPVQHEAGVRVPPPDYLANVRRACDEHGALLLLDEVKTGFGKMGSLFACVEANVIPDVLILGKSLGGGVIPSGAIVARKHTWAKFKLSFPMTASSYAGNSLACAAGLKSLEILRDSDLLDACKEKSRLLLAELRHLGQEYPQVINRINGKGLLLSLELRNTRCAFELARNLAHNGVLAMPAFGANAELMIEPPLVITSEQLTKVVECIRMACASLPLS